jgi:hypothetical protein
MDAAKLKRRQADIEAFVGALNHLLSTLEPDQRSYLGGPAWVPQAGRELEAAQLRGEVDRVAGRAAAAFASIPVFVEWKPPGTWQTQPVDPAQAWATILSDSPMFGPDVIFACANQALGVLDTQIVEAEEEKATEPAKPPSREGHRSGGHAWREATKWAGAVAGGLLVAYLAYRLGWSG